MKSKVTNTENEYNGWKNRQTWNVALWLNNDEGLYRAACEYMRTYKAKTPYSHFIRHMGMAGEYTPDGIKWLGTRLDYKALNEMMWEL